MSRRCEECNKGPKKAMIRSHALNKTLRVQRPNLQKFEGRKVCTKCRKTAIKRAAVA
ncbi:MAG: 50S ribosomal protein L28 [Candidatus Magasanikbacteria bacterium]|nr:50S ribosomal protein L28 [Candidatus Magasanikbacteria bacterium]|tara:strand:- start:7205 stop:7375 length:171 start_codon:yes stop_codon:yes gene_type:complete